MNKKECPLAIEMNRTTKIWPWILMPALLFGACRKEDGESIDAFDTVVTLDSPRCLFDDASCPLGNIECIGCWKGCLILQHSDAQKIFTLMDTCGQVLRTFCQVGHGHNECLSIGHGFTIENSVLSFYDRQAKYYCSFNLNDILQKDDSVTLEKRSVPYVVDFRPFSVTSLGDKYLCMGCFSDERFGCFGCEGERILHGIDYPFPTDDLTYLEKGTAYQGFMLPSPENGKFVIATYNSDVFEIYDVNGSAIRRTYVNPYKSVPPVVESGGRITIQTERSIAGLSGGYAAEEAFYFLYSGAGYEAYAQGGYKQSVILSFSWDGHKRAKYCLPFPIRHFAVSSGHLYAVAESDDVNRVYEFQLPAGED